MLQLSKIFLLLYFSVICISLYSQQSLNDKTCICLKKLKISRVYNSYEVEKKPEFPGGDAELIKFLAENLKCPVLDVDEIQSTIYAKFVISSSGKVIEACIFRPFYGNHLSEIEKELLRVIMTLPDWKPAEHKGKRVATWFFIPFRIDYQ